MRERINAPFSLPQRILCDRLLRDAVRQLCAGLPTRPAPRGRFDNVLESRATPWEPLLWLIFGAAKAGQSRKNCRAIGDAFHRIADGACPPSDTDGPLDPVAALVAEAAADAEADAAQARALAERTPDAFDHAASLTHRAGHAALHTVHVLTFHAFNGRQRRRRIAS